jgi:DNA helicase HerA-like ATPase
VTQNPLDIPETVLGQLGNRVQHALRAFTPRDQKAVRTAAETLRQNPAFDAEQAIGELAVGEALVSFLDEKGTPTVVERAWIAPPASRIGPISADERAAILQASLVAGHYEHAVDRESAYEKLSVRTDAKQQPADQRQPPMTSSGGQGTAAAPPRPGDNPLSDLIFGSTGPRGGRHEGILQSAARSAARSVGSGLGRQILRGMLGSIFGGRR